MIKTYRNKNKPQAMISYRLKAGDKALDEHIKTYCYASIFNGSVPTDCTVIEVFHAPTDIPYSIEDINRWVRILNDLGFPCIVTHDKDYVTFLVETRHYKHKLHILSTLMLIRTLIEDCLTPLPEFFFQAEDADPTIDRFKLMIDVHEKDYPYARDIHMVTYNGCERRVGSFDELMHQFESSKMGLHHQGRGPKGHCAVNSAWWGDYAAAKPKPEPAIEPEPKVIALAPAKPKRAPRREVVAK